LTEGLQNISPSLPTLVGRVTGDSNIVKMWKNFFKGILNFENSGNEYAEFVERSIDCKENYLGPEMAMCSIVSLTSLLQKLPLNKAPGLDFISAEYLLYAGESLCFFLRVLFNMCIVHGFVPNSCVTIIPICKNKTGNMSETSNYRPVAVATVVSKLLEHFILSGISPFLGTTDNLFGKICPACWRASVSIVAIGKARVAYVQSFTVWQQATIEFMHRNHSIIACSCHVYILLFFVHIPFVLNHIFNAMPPETLQQHSLLLQQTAPITRSFCEGFTQHDLHILVTAPFCCDRKSPSSIYVKLHTVAASNDRVHVPQSLYFCLFTPRIYIVVLRAHPFRGESHI